MNKRRVADELTPEQEKFVQELIKRKSQREAYRAAYPGSRKWLDKTVDERASRLFNKDKVNARYWELHDRLTKESEDECIIDAKTILRELAAIATADIIDYAQVVDDGGGGKVALAVTDTIPPEKRRAIAGIKATQAGVEIKLNDKLKALELLGRYLGLFTDNVKMTVDKVMVTDDV